MSASAQLTKWSWSRFRAPPSSSATRTTAVSISWIRTPTKRSPSDEHLLAEAKDYLVENLPVEVVFTEGRPVQVELPSSVQLKVVEAPEGLRGDTASNVTKPALLETGKTVNVPLFINEGEKVKIDTRTGAYMGRA